MEGAPLASGGDGATVTATWRPARAPGTRMDRDAKTDYPQVADLSAIGSTPPDPEHGLLTAFAVVRSVRKAQTKAGKPFVELRLGDRSASVGAKIWSESGRAMQTAVELPRGAHVKVLFAPDTYRGAVQLDVRGLREVGEGEPGYDASSLLDEGARLVSDLVCDTVVFDIETVPAHDLRRVPPTVAQAVTKYADRQEWDESKVMSLSPYFGKVVSLAVGDGEVAPDEQEVTVFVVPPEGAVLGEMPPWIRPVTETELLTAFWALAGDARCVVSYNGRGFDVPFLVGRSLVRGVPVKTDLMSGRFTLRPHLDLFDVLGGRGRGPSSLDVVCWALGVSSPKEDMDGSMVAVSYEKGELQKIAEYNAGDVRATTTVFQRVRDDVLRFRDDW